MDSTETMAAPPLPHSWLVASLAFAFLVGVSLSIPLLNGLSLAPTGYDEAVTAVRHGQAQSTVEKTIQGPCLNCAVSREHVPAETSPSVVDPHVAFRGSEGVEV